jgi:hypothetical protein
VPTLKDGNWYRSKRALALPEGTRLAGEPYRTPDGFALLVHDARGRSRQPMSDGTVASTYRPPALVMQATDGHDLMQLEGRDRIARVEFDPDALDDLEPLVEYDQLPESRKDYSVYQRGHKLV